MNTNTLSNVSTSPAPHSGIGSTLVIASCTAFLMVTGSVALWSQVEPVILLVARVAS